MTDDDAPPAIPDIRLGAVLGRGGFATVYAAIEGSDVAVKLAHVSTAIARERTARELAALERLAGLYAPLPLAIGDVAAGRF